jgi:hypothetical protein
MNFYKNIVKHVKEETKSSLLKSIIKLSLVILILFTQEGEYADILNDLLEVVKFGENWEKVFTDICLSLLHKGNSKI